MPPSEMDIAREWVGSSPCDPDLIEAITTHGTGRRAALAILRARRADLATHPAKWGVAGDYSEDASANLAALDDLIRRLERDLGIDDDGLPQMTSTPIRGPRLGR